MLDDLDDIDLPTPRKRRGRARDDEDDDESENVAFWKQNARKLGKPSRKTGTGKKRALTRRQWIEANCSIRSIDGTIIPLKLNAAQRSLEASVILQERAGVPVRQIILKARKVGTSTQVMAIAWERTMRTDYHKTLLVAHDSDTTKEVLTMASIMLEHLPKPGGGYWTLEMDNQASYHLKLSAPILSELKIASAEKKNPGHGFTPSLVHLSEMSRWNDAAIKLDGLSNSLPKSPSTMSFIESTARGDVGEFRDRFVRAWEERDVPIYRRKQGYSASFFPWFIDENYRWTRTIGRGRKIPDDVLLELEKTIQPHEKWLLEQKYFRRWKPDDKWEEVECFDEHGTLKKKWRRVGVGWRTVDHDQLLWRRAHMREELGGDPLKPETWGRFQEAFPATCEEAFLATGSPVFDASKIQERLKECTPPIFKGELTDMLVGNDTANPNKLAWDPVRYKFAEDRYGGLEIWKHPEPGKLYVAGIDTSAGGSQSDFASMTVIETRSRAVVAAWNGLYDPQQWGRMCATLGLYYNCARLAFETRPSQHGLTAVLAARDMGYTDLYRRREMGMVTLRLSEELGWATDVKTKPLLVDKVRVALSEGWEIPCEALLRQFLCAKRDKFGSLAFDGHDDWFISYSIAQVVTDDAVAGGFVSESPKEEGLSWEKRWWQHRKALASAPVSGERTAAPYDGL